MFYKTDEEGRTHGLCKLVAFFYYRNGTSKHFLIEESNYKHGELHGVSRHWEYTAHYCTPGGHFPLYELTYVDGVVDGPFKVYDNDTRLVKKEGTFKCGTQVRTRYGFSYPPCTLIGEYKSYTYFSPTVYGKQTLQEHIIYDADGNIADGPQQFAYDADGYIVGFITCTYKNGKRDGPWNAYSYTGDLLESATYSAGKKEGAYISYYVGTANSNYGKPLGIMRSATYKGGKLHGLLKTYDWPVDGKSRLHASEFWHNGAQIGKQALYQNGRPRQVITLKKDGSRLLHGPAWYYNDKDGSLVQKCNFKEGQLDGLLRFYNEKGICAQSILMCKGEPKEGSAMRFYDGETGQHVKSALIEHGESLDDLVTDGRTVRY